MKNLLSFCLFGTFLMVFVSCSTGPCSSKGYFLNEFEAFVDRIGEMEEDLTDQDWESKDEKYDVFTRQCYPKFKSEFTAEESRLYNKLTLKYKGYKAGGDVMNIIQGGLKGLSNLLNGESENLEANISDFIDQFKQDGDFNKIINQLKDELNEGGDLSETLEELKLEFEDDGKFKQAIEEFKEEFNEGELKEVLERLKVDLQEAGEDINKILEEENK